MLRLVQEKSKSNTDFTDLVKNMVGALRHDEYIPTRNLISNITWLETFIVTLHYHENTLYRCQQSHFAAAHALAEYGSFFFYNLTSKILNIFHFLM